MATAATPTAINAWQTHSARAGDVYSLVYTLPSPCEDRLLQRVGTRAAEMAARPRGIEGTDWDRYVMPTYLTSGNTWRRISDRVIEIWVIVTEGGPLGTRVWPTLTGVCANNGNATLQSVYYWDTRGGIVTAAMRAQDAVNAVVDKSVDVTGDVAEKIPEISLWALDKLIVIGGIAFAIWLVVTGRAGNAPRE